MNTKIDVVNDTFISVAENIQVKDAAARLLITAVLIAGLLSAPPVHYMGTMVAAVAYLFTTAIMRWDPLYALLGLGLLEKKPSYSARQSEGSVSHDVDSRKASQAANDAYADEDHLKKTG
jgi:hypothetical protein